MKERGERPEGWVECEECSPSNPGYYETNVDGADVECYCHYCNFADGGLRTFGWVEPYQGEVA